MVKVLFFWQEVLTILPSNKESSKMGITTNTNKMKVMIIKLKNITYDTFICDNNHLEIVSAYKVLGIDIHHKLN